MRKVLKKMTWPNMALTNPWNKTKKKLVSFLRERTIERERREGEKKKKRKRKKKKRRREGEKFKPRSRGMEL